MRRCLFWMGSAGLPVVLISLAFIHTPWGRVWLFSLLQAKLQQTTGLRVEAKNLRFNLFTLRFELESAVVHTLDSAGLPELAQAQHVLIQLPHRELWHPSLKALQISIEQLSINLLTTRGGRRNWPSSQGGGFPTLPKELPLTSVAVSNFSFSWKDEPNSVELRSPVGPLSLSRELGQEGSSLRFQGVHNGQIRWKAEALPFHDFKVRAVFRSGQLNVEDVQLKSGASSTTFQGWWHPSGSPELDLHVQVRLDTTGLSQFLILPFPMQGQINGDLLVSGTTAIPRVHGDLSATDLLFAGLRVRPIKASADWEGASPVIMLRNLEGGLLSGSFKAHGQFAFPKTGRSSLLSAELRGIDPEAALNLWRKSWPAVGRGTIRMEASCPELMWQKGQADVAFEFKSHRNHLGAVAGVSGKFSLKQEGDQTTRLTVQQFQLPGTQGHGSFVVQGEGRQLEGQIQVLVDSARELLPAVEEWMQKPPGTLQPISIDGALRLNAELSGSLHNPVLAAEVQGSRIALGRVHNVVVNFNGNFTPQQVQIENFRLDWENQSLQGSTGIDFSAPATSIKLKAEGREINLPNVLEGLGLSVPLKGTSDLRISASGPFSSPEAGLEFDARSLEYSGEPLGRLTGHLQWHPHQLVSGKLRLEKPQGGEIGVLEAAGGLNLTAKSFDFQLKSNPLCISNLRVPGVVPFSTRLQLEARGQGNIDAPTVDLKASSLDTVIGERDIGAIELRMGLARHRAEGTVQVPLLNLSSRLEIESRSPYSSDFQISLDNLDLAKLSIPVGNRQLLGGVLKGSIAGKLDLHQPETLEGKATLEKALVIIGGKQFVNENPLHILFSSQQIEFDTAGFSSGDSKLSFSGKVPIGEKAPPGVFQLRSSLGSEFLRSLVPQVSIVGPEGRIDTELSASGVRNNLDVTSTVTVHGGSLLGLGFSLPFSKLAANFSLKEDYLDLHQLVAEIGEGKIQATGMVPLALLTKSPPSVTNKRGPSKELRFLVEADHVPFGNAAGSSEGAAGRVSFRAEGGATEFTLPSLTAKVEFGELSLHRKQFQIEQARPLRLTISKGNLQVEDFELKGTESQFLVTGSAGLTSNSPLSLSLKGKISAAIIPLFIPSVQTDGQVELNLQLRGTSSTPRIEGFAHLRDGVGRWESPRIAAEEIEARIEIDGNRFRVAPSRAKLNGGVISGQGSFRLQGGQLRDVAFNLKGSDIFLDFPKGLETSSDFALEVGSNDSGLLVKGQLGVKEGVFLENIDFLGRSATALNFGSDLGSMPKKGSAGGTVILDLKIASQHPIQVRNNLADLLANFNFEVSGDLNRPTFGGSVRMEEGGKLYFGDRSYTVQRGVVTQSPAGRLDPYLDILANTRVNDYLIELRLSGVGKNITMTFTSDPALPEEDVISVLLTGQTVAQSRHANFDPKQAQSMILLSGALSTDLSAKLRRRFGISQVSIQPNAIASESDPGTRLTIAQDLTRSLRLIYSLNLADTQKQIWIFEYDFRRRFSVKLTKQEDNTYRGEFRHDIKFGGKPSIFSDERGKRTLTQKVGVVEFSGNRALKTEDLQKTFKLRTGQKFDLYKARSGLQKLSKEYHKHGYEEARIRMDTEDNMGVVGLKVLINEGLQVQFLFEGAHPPKKVRKQVRSAWQTGFIDQQRLASSKEVLRSYLLKEGYLDASVKGEVLPGTENFRRAFFDIDKGSKFSAAGVVLSGASPQHLPNLKLLLRQNHLEKEIYANPRRAVELFSRYYLIRGYLLAHVDWPKVEKDTIGLKSQVVIPIQEGREFHVAGLRFQGNRVLDVEQLRAGIPLLKGNVFSASRLDECLIKLEEKYRNTGYPGATIAASVLRDDEQATVDLVFQIEEKRRNVIQSVEVAGNDQTSQKFINGQLRFSTGESQNQEKINESLRGLYQTGGFRRVEIQPQPPPQVLDTKDGQVPVKMMVKVEEPKPFRFLYGGLYDSGTGPGVVTEFENRNSLGGARVAGARGRFERDFRELRVYVAQPVLRGWPWNSSVTFYVNRQDYSETYRVDKIGLSLQQDRSLGRTLRLSYGYKLETDSLALIGTSTKQSARQGILSAAFSRDLRDEFLDPRRGSFLSNTVEYAPSWLGSDYGYIRYFGQYSHYFPLIKPRPDPFGLETKRSPLVFASQVRLGLLKPLTSVDIVRLDPLKPLTSEDVVLTERFFAGGGNSIRGFPQDSVGPVNTNGVPIGGNALFILNNEIRFPMISLLEGVGFLDVGNVYPRISDLDFRDLRKSAGFGLRVKTPFILLRFDFGFPLDLRPGESRSVFFFSIGQSF